MIVGGKTRKTVKIHDLCYFSKSAGQVCLYSIITPSLTEAEKFFVKKINDACSDIGGQPYELTTNKDGKRSIKKSTYTVRTCTFSINNILSEERILAASRKELRHAIEIGFDEYINEDRSNSECILKKWIYHDLHIVKPDDDEIKKE